MNYKLKNLGLEALCVRPESIDLAEDKIIQLCSGLEEQGLTTLEITSSLLFSIHYLLTKEERQVTEGCFRYLFQQYREQMAAMPEFDRL